MNTKNIKKLIERDIKPFIDRLKKENYVQGIVLLGGLGKRNFLDEDSDIDISVFTYKKDKTKFPLPFEFHFKVNTQILEFNIHQQIIEDEEEKEAWDHSKIEAYSRGKIIYDPTKRVSNLIKTKIKFDKKFAYNRLIWILQQYIWRGQVHAPRACKRGYPEAAHDLLNQCGEILLEAIYLLNKRYLPHKKWTLIYLEDMPQEYSILKMNFKRAMLVKAFTLRDIKRRIKELNQIYIKITALVLKKYPRFPSDPYKYYYQNFVQLNKQTRIDRTLKGIKYKKFNRNYTPQEIEGMLCFNLLTSKRLLNRLLYSDNRVKRNNNKYKNGFGK